MHKTPALTAVLALLALTSYTVPSDAQDQPADTLTEMARWLTKHVPKLSGYHDRWTSGATTVTTHARYTVHVSATDRCTLALVKSERYTPVTTWETMRWVRRVDMRQLASIRVEHSALLQRELVTLKSGRWTAPIEVHYFHKKRDKREVHAEHYTTQRATIATTNKADAQRIANALERLRRACEGGTALHLDN